MSTHAAVVELSQYQHEAVSPCQPEMEAHSRYGSSVQSESDSKESMGATPLAQNLDSDCGSHRSLLHFCRQEQPATVKTDPMQRRDSASLFASPTDSGDSKLFTEISIPIQTESSDVPSPEGEESESDRSKPAEDKQPRRRIKLEALTVFCFVILALFVQCICLAVVTWRMPDPARNPELPDLGFELVGRPMLEIAHLSDLCIWIGNLTLIITFLLWVPFQQFRAFKALQVAAIGTPSERSPLLLLSPNDAIDGNSWPARMVARARALYHAVFTSDFSTLPEELIARVPSNLRPFLVGKERNLFAPIMIRYGQVYGLATCLRTVTLLGTSLPTPANECVRPPVIERTVQAVLSNALVGLATFGSGNKHCGDLLFSGHTIVLTVNFLTAWTYGVRFSKWIRPSALLTLVAAIYVILKSRSHYTDDIVFALYCTTSVFWLAPESLEWVFRRFRR